MKKKILVFTCLVCIPLLFTGCNKNQAAKEDPRKGSLSLFLNDWQKQDYSAMYKMLSDKNKSTLTEKDFTDRLKNIYDGIEALNISVTPQYPNTLSTDKDGTVSIPITFSMDTLAGKLSFKNQVTLIKEKHDKSEDWDIVWSDKMIFPQLEQGQKIGAQYYIAKRGEIIDRNGKPLASNGSGNVKRIYPLKEAAAQLIGYVKPISSDELRNLKSQGYSKYDYIGETGLEKAFEKRLKGENGGIIYTKDSNGQKKDVIAEKPVKDGENIKLTIDSDLQNSLFAQLQGDAGCAVAVQPKTGEVLAMVSAPSYDPNLFVKGISNADWTAITNNKQNPLTNRFSASFTPGSTFKLITAAIGLSLGKLNPDEGVKISGYQWQPNSSWGGYSVTRVDNVTEPVNLQKAFIYSDNIYFAQQALKIGKDALIEESKKVGIGEKIPFQYPLQSSQISKDGSIKSDIQLADSGYGQGEVSMNPVQLSMIYASLVNNGSILQPNLEYGANTTVWKDGVFSSSVCNTILGDLIQVVDNPNGTGHAAKIPGLNIAGKTGTAEIKQNQNDKNGTENGWFVAVNTDNPRLLVTMMIENTKSRGGSHYVVPKVATVMQQYLK